MDQLVSLLLVVGLGAGLAGWHYLSPRAMAKRLLRKVRTVAIAEAQEGQLVKIVGTLKRHGENALLQAPLSQRACVYYETVVQEWGMRLLNLPLWKTLAREKDGRASCWVVDDSGRALIQLANARVVVKRDTNEETGVLDGPTPAMAALLERLKLKGKGLLLNKTLRFREGVLQEGETVAVVGQCHFEPDPAPLAGQPSGYREPPQRLCLTPLPKSKLLITDDPTVIG